LKTFPQTSHGNLDCFFSGDDEGAFNGLVESINN